MHLRLSMYEAQYYCNENRHPQVLMKELGISYTHATPQSIADQWWFWNCSNVPIVLPRYLTDLDLDPREQVGYGLSEKEANDIYNLSLNYGY